MAYREYLIGEVAEEYTEGLLTRRAALRRLGLLGLALPAATALLAACGGDDDDKDSAAEGSADPDEDSGSSASPEASSSPEASEEPSRSADAGEEIQFKASDGKELTAAFKAPDEAKGAVLVIHENKGLQPHFYELVGRFAKEGYAALCVDLVSREGGTASLKNSVEEAPGILSAAPIKQLVGDLQDGISELERRAPDVKVGAVGFCFGGGMIWNLLNAGTKDVVAAVSFYGPPPEDLHFGDAKAAVLVVYAGKDERVNSSQKAIETALDKAKLTYEIEKYPDVDHAFFNDTGPRYDEDAAKKANTRMLKWFDKYLT